MAATVIVELTGDERKVLEAYRKVEAAEAKLRDNATATGEAAKAASKAFADAWIAAGEKSPGSLAPLLRELKRSGDEGKAAAAMLEKEMGLASAGSSSSVAGIVAKIGTLGPAAAEAAEKIQAELAAAALKAQADLQEADRQSQFKQTLDSLRKLGPEGKEMAAAIQTELEQSAAASAGSLDTLVAKLGELDPAAAAAAEKIKAEMTEAAAKAQAEMAEADKKSQFNQTLESLRKLGPQGKEMAAAIQTELEQSAASSAGSMDQIIAKLSAIDPAAAQAAEKIKVEMAAADSAISFARSIAELEKINPAAAKAAKSVRDKMDEADAAVKFDDIIAELEKIDPKAAEEAKKLKKHMKDAADQTGTDWQGVAANTAREVATIAAAYFGVGEAVQAVNGYITEQAALSKKSLDTQLSIAQAQQEAAKNLAAFSAVERSELLQEAAPEIQDATGFTDQSALLLALGASASKGATPEEAKAIVAAAARVELMTPDQVGDTAAGATEIMKKTGIQDPRQAIALLQTAGSVASVTEADKMVATLPKALGAAGTVRAQDPQEAARQIAAFFGAATKGGSDSEGTTTATFTVEFAERMSKMFADLDDQQIDARSRVSVLDKKIAGGTATEADQRDRNELVAFLRESEGMRDPATFFGRIQALQQNEAIRERFIGEGFGAAEFATFVKEILDSSTDAAKGLEGAFDTVKADVGFYDAQVAAQTGGTAQLSIANRMGAVDASIQSLETKDVSGATLASIREMAAKTLEATDVGGIRGFIDSFEVSGIPLLKSGIKDGGLSGSSAISEGMSAISMMSQRRDAMLAGGITMEEKPKIDTLEIGIENIAGLLQDEIERGSFDPSVLRRSSRSARAAAGQVEDSLVGFVNPEAIQSQQETKAILLRLAEAMDKQNALMEEQNGIVAETADNTRPAGADPNAVLAGSLAEADAR